VEDVISSWNIKAEEVRRGNSALWEQAKNQFILDQLDATSPTSGLGAGTRLLLEQLGVPAPEESTLLRIKVRVMAAQIADVLWKWDWDTMSGSRWETEEMALSETLRHYYPNDPDVHCVPQRHVRDFFRTPACRTAIKTGNMADL
jgi:hypothetical protein